jgi:hypothetical protein
VYHPRLADFRIGTAAVVATLFAIAYAPLVYKLSNQPRRGSGTDHPGLEPPR